MTRECGLNGALSYVPSLFLKPEKARGEKSDNPTSQDTKAPISSEGKIQNSFLWNIRLICPMWMAGKVRGEKGISHVQLKFSSPADTAEFTQGGISYNKHSPLTGSLEAAIHQSGLKYN